jgi:tetratricopeptide (TPR) repeat protein
MMRIANPLLPLVAISLLAMAAPSALADQKSEAKAHIEQAMIHHGNNRFVEALADLEAAYRLDPEPDLLFAIGQVNVKLGRCADAVSYYERFLATKPEAGPAAATREAIMVCKTKIAKEVRTEPRPEPEPKPEPEPDPEPEVATSPDPGTLEPEPQPPRVDTPDGPRPWYKDPIGGALVGGGVVAGVVGILFYRSATADLDRAESADTYEQSEDLIDRAKGRRTIGAIVGASGLVLVAGGVVRYLIAGDGTETSNVAIVPTSAGGAITWSGRW